MSATLPLATLGSWPGANAFAFGRWTLWWMKSLYGVSMPRLSVDTIAFGALGSLMSKPAVPPEPACHAMPAPSTFQWWPAPLVKIGFGPAAGDGAVPICFGLDRSDRSKIENLPSSPAE